MMSRAGPPLHASIKSEAGNLNGGPVSVKSGDTNGAIGRPIVGNGSTSGISQGEFKSSEKVPTTMTSSGPNHGSGLSR